MLSLSAAWTYKEGLPPEQGSQGFGTAQSQSVVGQERIQYIPPHTGTGQRGQVRDRGRGRGPQAGTTGVQGRVYAVIPPVKSVDQPVIQGMFLLSCLSARVLFDSSVSHLFIAASVEIDLGLEVEAFREMMGNSSLGCSVRVGQMCRDRGSGILVILLIVDLRVVDILGVDVILDMDELTAIRLSVIGTLVGLSYPT